MSRKYGRRQGAVPADNHPAWSGKLGPWLADWRGRRSPYGGIPPMSGPWPHRRTPPESGRPGCCFPCG